jgi:diguanylate cyclase (GGDEF)-like protein
VAPVDGVSVVVNADQHTTHVARCDSCGQPLGWTATDRLTGLLDRWGWDDQVPAALEQLGHRRLPAALLMVDLDWFKVINDQFGHLVGDRVLQATARALRSAARPTDLVCRYGGDEFVVLLPGTSPTDALTVAQRIHVEIHAAGPVTATGVTGDRIQIEGPTVSIGVAVCVLGGSAQLHDLLSDADAALRDAKRNGRDQTRVAHPRFTSTTVPAPIPRAEQHRVTEKNHEGTTMMEGARFWVGFDDVLRLLNGKWDSAVLEALSDGPLHWSDILSAIRRQKAAVVGRRNGILHESVLARTLLRMERDGLVLRMEKPAIFPPSVTYELTPRARSLIKALTPAAEWAASQGELGAERRQAM